MTLKVNPASKAIIISFYTPEWEYASRAKELIHRCNELGLQHDIQPRQSLNNWNKNTAMKPLHIREALRKHEHVIWLDCDGTLFERPELCLSHPEHINILACKHQSMRHHATTPREWHTGMLSIRHSRMSRMFVDRWIDTCDLQNITDELAFHRVALSFAGSIVELPPHYHRTMMRGVNMTGAVYGMGISQSPDKLAMKARQSGVRRD